ncbi:hypothetical protein RD792_012754 [Penstemon davidsonii]|nr:hypothetical protein RD792_012754 [Penstemon davidsonii]
MTRLSRSKRKARGSGPSPFSERKATGSGPSPFSEIGRRARDLLTKDYNYDQKFTLSIPSSTGMGLTATGVKKDQIFAGDIGAQYKSENTTINVKVDTYSNISTVISYDVLPGTKAAIRFKVPDHKSGKVQGISTKLSYDLLPGTKAAISFTVPDHKSGKLDVHYLHRHAAINSSIGLNPTPLLEVSAAIGYKDVGIGGEIGFDTASSSFIKCNAGISINKPDFSAALILTDKGQTVKASYVQSVNPVTGTEVAVEMSHKVSRLENSFSIGSVHKVNPLTLIKTRFSNNGKIAILSQHKWRPNNSLVTVSAEFGTNVAPKFGLAIALKS